MTENEFGFTEILKHVNDLSGSIDVEAILKKAEAIFLQIAGCRAPPKEVASILGLEAMLFRGSGSSGCSRAGAGEKGVSSRSVLRNDAKASKGVNGKLRLLDFGQWHRYGFSSLRLVCIIIVYES